MTEKTKAGTARRPYEPPQLEQVQLVVEEALQSNCKTKEVFGFGQPLCVPTGGANCQGSGS